MAQPAEIKEVLSAAIFETVWAVIAAQFPWARLPGVKTIAQILVARAIVTAIHKHSEVPWIKEPREYHDRFKL